MSKSGSAPAAPDYSGLINSATQQSQQYNNIMNNELQFAQNTYQQNLPIYQQSAQESLNAQTAQDQFANQQRANYQQLYNPLQQQFVGQVSNYDSPDQAALARGQAMSAVGQQYGAAGDAAKRQLQSYGVDPSSGRTAALDIGTRTGQAAAEAAAGTQSDINRQTTGLGLEATALGIGNQLPGQATASNAGATGAGTGAVNATTNSYTPYAGAIANPVAFGGLANQSLGLAGQLTGQQYQGQLGQYGANQNSSSGFGSLLGTAASVASMIPFAAGGRVPTPHGAVSTDFPSPAARGSIPTPSRTMSLPRGLHRLSAVPLTMKFADGGAVPAGLSPSGGAQTDDVQATVGQQGGPPQGGARINVGEYIVPKDVSDWLGTKFLQNMVTKARKDMGGAVGGSPPQGAPLQGTPSQGQGAVPAGKPYAAGGSVGAIGGAVAGGVPPPRVASAAPHVALRRPAPSRSMMAARGHTGAINLSPGAGGGAGPGVGMNLGGHQPPRPSMAVEGSNAGAVRTAVPGV